MAVEFVAGEVGALDEIRAASADVRDLARRLGVYILEAEGIIEGDLDAGDESDGASRMETLRVAVAQLSLESWPDAINVLSPTVLAAIRALRSMPELALLGFLQGLCSGGGALSRFYRDNFGEITLTRGDVYPLPIPPLNPDLHRPTPHPLFTIRRERPLPSRVPFDIYKDARWSTVLVFSDKETLDANVWEPTPEERPGIVTKSLRRMAAVFPLGVDQLDLPLEDVTADDWFGVAPKVGAWQEAKVGELLTRAGSGKPTEACSIVLLPELTLPDPDALDDVVARTPSVPPIVVAGSAHHTTTLDSGKVIYSNSSVVYHERSPLLRHRKVHAFQTDDPKILGPGYVGGKLPERLSPDGLALQIAVGRHTRLAVLICADIFDLDVVMQLVEMMANLVLVPSFTLDDRGFDAIRIVTELNQGTVVVANAGLDPWAVVCHVPDVGRSKTMWSPTNGYEHPFGVTFDAIDLEQTATSL